MTVNIAEYTGNVIKVGGQCYQFVGVVPDDGSAVTSDAVFETCEECAQGSSAEEVSSAQEVSSEQAVSSAQEVSSAGAAPETKSFLGVEFTKGESKIVCPRFYKRESFTGYSSSYTSITPMYVRREHWTGAYSYQGRIQLINDARWDFNTVVGTTTTHYTLHVRAHNRVYATYYGTGSIDPAFGRLRDRWVYEDTNNIGLVKANPSFPIVSPATANTYTATLRNNIATDNLPSPPTAWAGAIGHKPLSDHFGQITTTDGLTISWEALAGVAPADWGANFTAGNYGATTGGEATVRCQPADDHDDKPRMRVTLSW